MLMLMLLLPLLLSFVLTSRNCSFTSSHGVVWCHFLFFIIPTDGRRSGSGTIEGVPQRWSLLIRPRSQKKKCGKKTTTSETKSSREWHVPKTRRRALPFNKQHYSLSHRALVSRLHTSVGRCHFMLPFNAPSSHSAPRSTCAPLPLVLPYPTILPPPPPPPTQMVMQDEPPTSSKPMSPLVQPRPSGFPVSSSADMAGGGWGGTGNMGGSASLSVGGSVGGGSLSLASGSIDGSSSDVGAGNAPVCFLGIVRAA